MVQIIGLLVISVARNGSSDPNDESLGALEKGGGGKSKSIILRRWMQILCMPYHCQFSFVRRIIMYRKLMCLFSFVLGLGLFGIAVNAQNQIRNWEFDEPFVTG
jgi:hypothetical protein